MNEIGTYTTTSVSVTAIAARPISPRPFSAAAIGFSPRLRCRVVFSRTTMESSTRMPIISAMAIREMVFRLKPMAYMSRKVLTRQVGIETSTIAVLRQVCRKRKRTTAVMMMARKRSFFTASTA